jgi:hypothetical protein
LLGAGKSAAKEESYISAGTEKYTGEGELIGFQFTFA